MNNTATKKTDVEIKIDRAVADLFKGTSGCYIELFKIIVDDDDEINRLQIMAQRTAYNIANQMREISVTANTGNEAQAKLFAAYSLSLAFGGIALTLVDDEQADIIKAMMQSEEERQH